MNIGNKLGAFMLGATLAVGPAAAQTPAATGSSAVVADTVAKVEGATAWPFKQIDQSRLSPEALAAIDAYYAFKPEGNKPKALVISKDGIVAYAEGASNQDAVNNARAACKKVAKEACLAVSANGTGEKPLGDKADKPVAKAPPVATPPAKATPPVVVTPPPAAPAVPPTKAPKVPPATPSKPIGDAKP